jgi:hypothetical protein
VPVEVVGDGDDADGEVDVFPAQRDDLAAPEPGVDRDELIEAAPR